MTKKLKKGDNQPAGKNFNLFIYEQLKQGLNPAKISKEFGLSLPLISYHIAKLKERKLIKKVGYGTYEILAEYSKEVKEKSTRVATNNPQENFNLFKPDSVRGHAFQFTLSIDPNLRNWGRREEILKVLGIEFKRLNIFGGGQSILFKGRKVWLTRKSIIFYEPESFISEKADESQSQAINHFIKLIKELERELRANFSFNGKYRFRVTRQHYSLIKNALAKQYDEEGKKLNIYNDKGLWFIIDNSFNLHEAETIHPKTAVQDNVKVQDFFNGLKETEGYTPQFVVNAIANQTQNLDNYAIHLKSHVKSVQDLGKGVSELVEVIKELKKQKDI